MTWLVGAALAGAVFGGLGCRTMQPVQEPAQFIQDEHPSQVNVVFTNNSQVTLLGPRVTGDSLFGRVAGVSHPVAAPLSDVAQVNAVQPDRARTKWLIAGVSVSGLSLMFLVMQGGSNNRVHPCEDLGSSDCDYLWELTR
jgi:hypothetical protein